MAVDFLRRCFSSSTEVTEVDRHASTSNDAGSTTSSRGSQRPAPRIPRGEVYRKILHMTPGLLPFLLAVVPHPDPLEWVHLAAVTLICVVLTSVFLALHRIVRRPGENGLVMTAVSYPATIVAVLWLFPAHAELAAVVVVVLAFGDGSAYLGGTLLGGRSLPWNPHKTWAGTCAFVVISAPIAVLAYWIECRPTTGLISALLVGSLSATAGAVAESLPVKLTDNLRVGLAAAVAAAAVHFTM